MIRTLAIAVLVASVACSSTPERPAGGVEDRTDDPEFAVARERADREFESQAEALEAGVYERFRPPDSIATGSTAAEAGRGPRVDRRPQDPSTEELLGTLPASAPYNPRHDATPVEDPRPVGEDHWSLQMGAFSSESGALVRVRQLEHDFPDVPRWSVRNGVVRVYLGRFGDRGAAASLLERVREKGYADAWVTRAP